MGARNTRRARRKADEQARRRWLGMLGLVLGLGLLVSAGGFGYHYVSQPGRLPLRVGEVSGSLDRLDRGAIERTVAEAIDGGFFSCDMQRLRAAVVAMPWVADVSVRRIWPDRLHMAVTEQVPLARWGDDALVSVAAGVFRPDDMAGFGSLVELHGPHGSQQRVVQFYQAVLPATRALGLQVAAVRLDERRHWWLHFVGGLTVSLGREQVDQRLAQFLRVFPSLSAQSGRLPERIDMRYEHGFAVRWREPAGQDPVAEQESAQGKV